MTTQSVGSQPPHGRDVFQGPPLRWVSIVFPALFVLSLIVAGLMTAGARVPRPDDPRAAGQAYFSQFGNAVRATAFFQFGAAIPLGIFTATVISQLRYLGVRAAGFSIAQFGGYAAAGFQAMSALFSWTLSQPGIAHEAGTMRALQLLAFASGGVGHVVPLGLLLAGVSVTCYFARLLPRWLTGLGIALAVIAELSVLGLAVPQAAILIPLARFPSLIWLICAGFALPVSNNGRFQERNEGTA